jgi:hypothetical protein
MHPGQENDPNVQFAGLFEFSRAITSGAIGREQTLERSTKLFRKAALIADKRIAEVLEGVKAFPLDQQEAMSPKCYLGCAHCCYQWVRATVPEVFAAAEFIRANWSAEEIDALLVRCREYRAIFGEQVIGQLFSLACPLLKDDKCPIYDVRPFSCRGCCSMDAQKCLEGKEDPNSGVMIPTIMPVLMSATAIRQGMQFGMMDAGYMTQEVVFALGLETTLADPTVPERFFAGEPVFQNDISPPSF